LRLFAIEEGIYYSKYSNNRVVKLLALWSSSRIMVPKPRGVHGVGQPRKPGQTHPKNPKKWVGLGNWVGMVSKKRKTHKNKWVSDKTRPKPKKPTYPIMLIFFIFIFIG